MAIIIITLFILTYIVYRISAYWDFNFPPKTLFLCSFFAFILGLLLPQVVAYASSVTMWLLALVSLLVLSSYVLSKSTDNVISEDMVSNELLTSTNDMPHCVEEEKHSSAVEHANDSKCGDNFGHINETDSHDEDLYWGDVNETKHHLNMTVMNGLENSFDQDELIQHNDETIYANAEDIYWGGIEESDGHGEELAVTGDVEYGFDDDDNEANNPLNEITSPNIAEDIYWASLESVGFEEGSKIGEINSDAGLANTITSPQETSPEDADTLYSTEEHNSPTDALIDETGEINETDEHDTQNTAYYLDLGFTAKESLDYSAAIAAFQKVVDIERDNPSVLYIITEICALLKLQGFYEEALRQMREGQDMAVGFQDLAMAGEFAAGIAYLQILNTILAAKNLQYIPFLSLPQDVQLTVDEEFRQWQKNR